MTIHDRILALSAPASILVETGMGGIAPASACEVWLMDQFDRGKESGGLLHIYKSITVWRSQRTQLQQNRKAS